MVWQGIKDFFGGIWDAVWSLVKNAGLLIWGIIKGLVEGIWSFFKWIYNELVGHSIIPDIVNGVIGFFKMMASVVEAVWHALVSALKWIWNNILKPVFEAVMAIVRGVVDVFKFVVAMVKYYWNLFVEYIRIGKIAFALVIQAIKDKWNDIVDGVKGMYNTVKGWIDKFVSGVIGIKDRIKNAFVGIFDGLSTAFKSAVNWMIGKWNDFHLTLGGGSVLGVDIPEITLNTPNIPFMARGGAIYGNATAIVGEGRPGFPEYVIPTDPMYRDRAKMLFEALGGQLGLYRSTGNIMSNVGKEMRKQSGGRVSLFASGGILGRGTLRTTGDGGMVLVVSHHDKREYHFHGDLSFPNVRGEDDADKFLKNLKAITEG
jgi:hypothetical protein